jgi:hypothetical protein
MEKKSPFKSWTLYVNTLIIVVSAALGYLNEVAPGVAWLGTATGIVNVLLRFKTSQPVV